MKKIFTLGVAMMMTLIGWAQMPSRQEMKQGNQRLPKHEQLASLQQRGEAVDIREIAVHVLVISDCLASFLVC